MRRTPPSVAPRPATAPSRSSLSTNRGRHRHAISKGQHRVASSLTPTHAARAPTEIRRVNRTRFEFELLAERELAAESEGRFDHICPAQNCSRRRYARSNYPRQPSEVKPIINVPRPTQPAHQIHRKYRRRCDTTAPAAWAHYFKKRNHIANLAQELNLDTPKPHE